MRFPIGCRCSCSRICRNGKQKYGTHALQIDLATHIPARWRERDVTLDVVQAQRGSAAFRPPASNVLPSNETKESGAVWREFYPGRYETKYVIPKRLVPKIREFIRPFCEPDSYGVGDPPQYTVTTLQLDSPGLSLHYAKLWDFVNRFKLRARTYGDPVGGSPVFIEVKAKNRATVQKLRSEVPFDKWGEHLFRNEIIRGVEFKSGAQAEKFYQFVRLVKEIGARPVMLIKYRRESYFGKLDHYSRISFDTALQYQQTYSWDSWGRGRQWNSLDNPMIQTRRHDNETDYSGVVMEIKTLHDVPLWLINLVGEFGMDRQGHCKYSNAVWADSLFRGTPWTPEYEVDLLNYL